MTLDIFNTVTGMIFPTHLLPNQSWYIANTVVVTISISVVKPSGTQGKVNFWPLVPLLLWLLVARAVV